MCSLENLLDDDAPSQDQGIWLSVSDNSAWLDPVGNGPRPQHQ